jgi:hypothetical protein
MASEDAGFLLGRLASPIVWFGQASSRSALSRYIDLQARPSPDTEGGRETDTVVDADSL